MLCSSPFLVGTGKLEDLSMQEASLLLAKAWGGSLYSYSCEENPLEVLKSLPNEVGLVQLSGDAAKSFPTGGSWLEALGAWRQPTILLKGPFDGAQGDAWLVQHNT